MFQSTHPQGVRRTAGFIWLGRVYGFNPRTRRGCDVGMTREHCLQRQVSIHAPAGGATWQPEALMMD